MMDNYCRVCGKMNTKLAVCSIECGASAALIGIEHQATIAELENQLAPLEGRSVLDTLKYVDNLEQRLLTSHSNQEDTIAEQRKLLQRWLDDIHINKDASLWGDTEALLDATLEQRVNNNALE